MHSLMSVGFLMYFLWPTFHPDVCRCCNLTVMFHDWCECVTRWVSALGTTKHSKCQLYWHLAILYCILPFVCVWVLLGAVWKSRWTSWAPVPNKRMVFVHVKQLDQQQQQQQNRGFSFRTLAVILVSVFETYNNSNNNNNFNDNFNNNNNNNKQLKKV